MAFNLFPYSNFHKLNLDWVIKEIKEAKAAIEEAAQTVTSYESRLATLESDVSTLSTSVSLLRGTVSGHTARLDQAQQDIANQQQQLNTLDSSVGLLRGSVTAQGLRLDQAQQDIADHTQQINTIQGQISGAVSDSAQALAAATQASQAVAGKVDQTGGHAYGLRVIYSAQDADNGVVLEGMAGPYNGVAFRPLQSGQISAQLYSPITVAAPTSRNHAATKGYVDGTSNTVTGTTVEITPANNNIYQCGTLEQLTITTPPSSGAYSILFTSGATPTTTVIPATILGLETFVAAANTIYEINVLDNRAVVGSWEVTSA